MPSIVLQRRRQSLMASTRRRQGWGRARQRNGPHVQNNAKGVIGAEKMVGKQARQEQGRQRDKN